ncbi:antibiotic transporter [Cellulomonas chitinilytica]|uniref:Antibiotic transporter n=1 Tax=Cellulomonas chitinilytica TaxID=398759 RepID=A0A919P8Z9_9CELL|nr:penicillin acylase family protein [Cellulomonas chitinilytica]GIG23464.1 antibiotic transporter [Cellulomonas chitinilytica]
MTADLFRDAWGVPHVRAGDHLALARGQGRVTALDRGWQIEVDRWRAEGRLAEHLGAAGVEWDRFARRARLADTAQRAFDRLPADVQDWVAAYVDGVRDGLLAGGRPPEVAALDARFGDVVEPEPWPVWAPLGVLLVAHALFSTFPRLLWHDHVLRTLGPELAAVVVPDGTPPGRDAQDGTAHEPVAGSNAWALHGSRTASGRPLLAGDPHRILELPGPYQQVRLACPEYDVVGLAFPGVPGVAHFGHTGTVAWGITNAMAHHVDLFRERLHRDGDRVRALGPDGWEPTTVSTERIGVRGADDEPVEILETRRGPVVVDRGAGAAYSVRMPARVDLDLGVACLPALLRARTAHDVAAAFAGWVDPVNRVLTADTDGTVLSLTAGRAPVRPPSDRRFPLDAWSPAARPAPWLVLPEPVAVTGVAVDANERPAGRAPDLGSGYPSSSRAHRIADLLRGRGSLTVDDLAAVHGDTLLPTAEPLLARAATLDGLTPAADAARARLLAWDRRMDAASPDAALFVRWRSAVIDRLVAHPVLAPLHEPHGDGALFDPWFAVAGRVADALPRLLDEPALDPAAVLRDAWEDVATVEPQAWGDVHRVRPVHVLDGIPGVVAPTVAAVPLAGDGDCVRSTTGLPGFGGSVYRGSVARWVWDLDDRRNSRWGVPFGAASDPRDPHFTDQLGDWAAARTVPVVTDWELLDPEPWPVGGTS